MAESIVQKMNRGVESGTENSISAHLRQIGIENPVTRYTLSLNIKGHDT